MPCLALLGFAVCTVSDPFQSNGLCFDHCKADFAFALVQGNNCWCSNYIPDSTTSGCEDPCPGYPSDTCGSTDQDLYGYMVLPNKPSGTRGVDSTVSPTSPRAPAPTITAAGPTQTVIIVCPAPPCA